MREDTGGFDPRRLDSSDPAQPTGDPDTDPALPVDRAPWPDRLRLDELRLLDHRRPGAALLAAYQKRRGEPGPADPLADDRDLAPGPTALCPTCGRRIRVELVDVEIGHVWHVVHCGWGHEFASADLR